MKAHVAKAKLIAAATQLPLPIGTQGQGRVAAAYRVLPKMRQRSCCAPKIAAEHRIHDQSCVVTMGRNWCPSLRA